jgi:hypothetical protein
MASFSTEHGPAMIVNVPGPMAISAVSLRGATATGFALSAGGRGAASLSAGNGVGSPLSPGGRGDGVAFVHLAAGELERLGDPNQLEHAWEHLERPRIDGADVAGDADGSPRCPRQRVRRQVHLLDRGDDPLDLFRRGMAIHDNQHDRTPAVARALGQMPVYHDGEPRGEPPGSSRRG